MAVRTRKIATSPVDPETSPKPTSVKQSTFDDLILIINSARKEFEVLQTQIQTTKNNWVQEQMDRDTARKREAETYDYETSMARRKASDDFATQKQAWEKQLQEEKDKIVLERKELETLRKQVSSYPADVEKVVKEANTTIQKQLEDKFAIEKKLLLQDHKSEKDLLTLRIENLVVDRDRLTKEVETLKKSLEQATTQLKDVAIRVIDSKSISVKEPLTQAQ